MSDKPRTYSSESIDVTYELKRCIHAAECVQRLNAVFDNKKRPWIQPEQASADAIAETIHHCPTGALTYERKDGGASEVPDSESTLQVVDNGPVHLRGDITLTVAGEDHTAMRMSLCRCGASENKPYCDNSHQKISFSATENNTGSIESTSPNTPLHVTPQPNGSVKVEGSFTIKGDDDEVLYSGIRAFLCRCGSSSNKPFCDGTHKKIGFQAE
jgi:CDGSH-type Zn-finger protein/uncharacterized Fe-S cluster protein YjdI